MSEDIWEGLIEHVSNTYLVFRKIKSEFGMYYSKEDDEWLNKKLTTITKNIYIDKLIHDDIDQSLIKTLKKYKDFWIVAYHNYSKELKKDFNILVLTYNRNIILLNYIEAPLEFRPVEDFYVADIYNKDEFSSYLKMDKKSYCIINTFDSFISFVDANNINRDIGSNYPFYNNFKESLAIEEKNIINGTIDTCYDYNNAYKEMEYTYAILDDVILILSYKTLA